MPSPILSGISRGISTFLTSKHICGGCNREFESKLRRRQHCNARGAETECWQWFQARRVANGVRNFLQRPYGGDRPGVNSGNHVEIGAQQPLDDTNGMGDDTGNFQQGKDVSLLA